MNPYLVLGLLQGCLQLRLRLLEFLLQKELLLLQRLDLLLQLPVLRLSRLQLSYDCSVT